MKKKLLFSIMLIMTGYVLFAQIASTPTIVGVNTPSSGTYKRNQALFFYVSFTENLVVNTSGGIPELSITIGATTRQAVFGSASGHTMSFIYLIQDGEIDTDGITVGTISLNGGTIKSSTGIDVNTTLNGVASTSNVFVNAISPRIASITRQNPTISPTDADVLTWDVTFNETVSNVDVTDFNVSGTTATITSVTNPSGNIYRVTASGGNLAGLDATVTLGFSGASQSIKNSVGNGLINLTPIGINNKTFVISNTPIYTWTGAFQNSNSWHISINWDQGSTPPANADVVIPSGLSVYPTAFQPVEFNSLTINSGASFIANSSVTGEITYKRNLPTTNWYLVTAPISGESSEDIIANHTFATGTVGGNIGIGTYLNNIGSAWAYSNLTTTGAVQSGAGLSMKLATPGEISITGVANTLDVIFLIAKGTRDNFNLIGNPFTSYVNSATFTTANTGLLSEETVWLWNGTAYVTHNENTPIEIAPGQGFFVEAGHNGYIIFAESNQSHQNDTFMREVPKSTFELSVEEGTNKSATKVFYVDNKTTGFDNGYDSKMFGGTDYQFKIYTELVSDNKGKKLAIQTLPNQNIERMVIPVGLIAQAGKKITFSVKSQNLPDNSKVFLEDRINNTFTNISEKPHKVVLENQAKGAGQFYIHTTSKNLEIAPIQESLQNVSIYKSAKNSITITGLQTENASVNVYSILGEKVISKKIKATGVNVIQLPKTTKGVYIVELISDLGKITKKIILE